MRRKPKEIEPLDSLEMGHRAWGGVSLPGFEALAKGEDFQQAFNDLEHQKMLMFKAHAAHLIATFLAGHSRTVESMTIGGAKASGYQSMSANMQLRFTPGRTEKAQEQILKDLRKAVVLPFLNMPHAPLESEVCALVMPPDQTLTEISTPDPVAILQALGMPDGAMAAIHSHLLERQWDSSEPSAPPKPRM